MRLRARVAAALLASLAAGCAIVEPAAPPRRTAVAAPRAPSPAEEMLAYLEGLRELDEAGLAAEAARQRELALRMPSPQSSMRAAIALSSSPQSEEAEILALVGPLAGDPGADAALRGMASFLQGLASERRRLKESAAAAGARSRDDRRAQEAQKQRADALQEKAAQLQQKLDALTNLEKSLSSRQAPKR